MSVEMAAILSFWSGRSNFSSLFDLIKRLLLLLCCHHEIFYLFLFAHTIEISKIMHGYCLQSHIKLNRCIVAVNKINRYFVNKSWSMEWKEWTQFLIEVKSRKEEKHLDGSLKCGFFSNSATFHFGWIAITKRTRS